MKSTKKMLSIIIPAYNVEQYILDCLESVFAQDLSPDEFEVIVINDGSTDSTLEYIQHFQEKNNNQNLKIISQENKGLSGTRNLGLQIAKGEYVWFVDSDDWIEKKCLGYLKDIMKFQKPEIIALNTDLNFPSHIEKKERPIISRKATTGYDIFRESWIYPYSGAQFYIFKTVFLRSHSFSFKEGIFFEDLLFTPVVLDHTDNIAIAEKTIYHYRLRDNSITTSTLSLKKAKDLLTILDDYLNYLGTQKYVHKEIYSHMVLATMTTLVRKYVNHLNKKESKYIRESLNQNKALLSVVSNSHTPIKYKLIYFMSKFFPFFAGK